MCGLFVHTKRLSTLVEGPVILILSTGVSIKSHKIRAQSHNTGPTSDTNLKSQTVICPFDPPAMSWGF